MILAEVIDKMWSYSQLSMLTAFLLFLTIVASYFGRGITAGLLIPLTGLTVLTYAEFVSDDLFYFAIRQELGGQYFYFLFATSLVPMLYIAVFLLLKRRKTKAATHGS